MHYFPLSNVGGINSGTAFISRVQSSLALPTCVVFVSLFVWLVWFGCLFCFLMEIELIISTFERYFYNPVTRS